MRYWCCVERCIATQGNAMENARIGAIFDRIADILEIQGGNPFRIRSYRNAARTVRDLTDRLADLADEGKDLTDLPGIGDSIAEKIHEILRTGTCRTLRDLQDEVPAGLPELLKVPNLGPKRAKQLYDDLGIASLDDLKKAAEAGKIRGLEGFGEKTEQQILQGLETVRAEAGRHGIKEAMDRVEDLGRHLDGVKGIARWQVAGSFRRRRETVGDLDILVRAKDRGKAADGILAYEAIDEVQAHGEEKITVRLAGGMQVDFRFIDAESFGAAQMYFTGSKAHNITLRKRAQRDGLKLNEYGLFKGKKRKAGKTEEEVYGALGLPWIPPELREDRGEIDAADAGGLPDLIEPADIRGDLHAHTSATDGANTIDELVRAARGRKYAYLAVTDHSKAVTVAGGLDDDALRRHADKVRKAAAGEKRFGLLAGVEVDILKSGRLDIGEKVLADLDWVVASVHSYFHLDADAMTDRLLAAVRSGVVHCLGHPFGRLIGRRDPLRFDAERVFEACRDEGVCLEINAYPDRLDLPDVWCKRAREIGCTMVVACDVHKTSDMDFMGLGVSVARRGWLEKGDVLNTRTLSALRKWLKT